MDIECSKCGVAKAREAFYKRGDGLRTQCKECESAAYKQWASLNAERRKAINDRYEEAHPDRAGKYRAENPAKVKESTKQWRAANLARYYANNNRWRNKHPEITERLGKAYRAANAEKARAKTIQWRKDNPEKANAAGRLKRARKAAAEGRHTAADIEAIWIRQGKKCAVPSCEHPISEVRGDKDIFHVDHIIPLKPKSGPAGTNWPSNLQILCWKHNTQKRNRDPYKWAEENGLRKAAPEDAALNQTTN